MSAVGGAVPPGPALPPATPIALATTTPSAIATAAVATTAPGEALTVRVLVAGSDPAALAAAGAGIEGEITTVGRDGRLAITTAAGVLQVRSAQPLPLGTRLVIGFAATGPSSPPSLLLQLAGAGAGASANTAAGAVRAGSAPAVVAATALPTAAITDPRPLIALTLGPTVWRAPADAAGDAAGVLSGETPAALPLPQRSLVPVRMVAMADLPPAVRVDAAATASPRAPLAADDVLPAVVRSVLATGERVVDAGGSSFLLPAAAGGRPGEAIGLVLAGRPLPALSLSPADAASVASNGEPQPRSEMPVALRAAAEWLQGDASRAALLPRPGPELTRALCRFLAGARPADSRDWLGPPATDALARTRPDLSAALDRCAEETSPDARPAPGQAGWTQACVPLLVDAQVAPLHLAWRGQQDERGGDNASTGERRLLVDVAFSRLGRTQLDALLSPASRTLAVVVRTREPLPDAARREIAEIVDRVAGEVRCRADLHFATDGRFVEPPAPRSRVPGGLIV